MMKLLVALAFCGIFVTTASHIDCRVGCECDYGHRVQPTDESGSDCGSSDDLTNHLLKHATVKPIIDHLCRGLISALPHIVNNETLKGAFTSSCTKQPPYLRNMCKALERKYSAAIAEKIDNETPRSNICHELGLGSKMRIVIIKTTYINKVHKLKRPQSGEDEGDEGEDSEKKLERSHGEGTGSFEKESSDENVRKGEDRQEHDEEM